MRREKNSKGFPRSEEQRQVLIRYATFEDVVRIVEISAKTHELENYTGQVMSAGDFAVGLWRT